MLAPPYSSDTVMPSTPRSPILRHRSIGNWSLGSISAARGAISDCAKSRTASRRASTSSPNWKFRPGMLAGMLMVFSCVNGGCGPDQPLISWRPVTVIRVQPMVATSFSCPLASAYARPSHTVMVRPGLSTRPSMRKLSPWAGASRLILNSMVRTAASSGMRVKAAKPQAESSAVETMPACRKPCCCVSACDQSSSMSTAPGSSRASRAPSVCMAPCRTKLSRTRCANWGSRGSNRGVLMRRPNLRLRKRQLCGIFACFGQQGTRLFFMLLDFVQVGLQVGHLVFELPAVLFQHIEELLQLHIGVARAVVEINDLLRLGQRQTQTFGTQGQFQAGAVACSVGSGTAARPGTLGLQESHVLVEAHRARGEVELFGKIADRVGGGHGVAKAGGMVAGFTDRICALLQWLYQ